ncbi:DUF1127 domain-containing protein [Mesorhizobium sp. YR577]|uniref:DUF1127 domain-containing protein n=1 Tax=Mesorhizobium sp. YR577 TaxID=1884373 RepID=UPI0008E326F7|nr:DUF1127 domain-containing protein [Mesorhizobium sp. YR577]SFU23284.1 protein of unknown function [Mesorhizobium sp. YR577]
MFRLVQSLIAAVKRVRHPTLRSQTSRRLSDLDERLLDDIGISREQARDIDQATNIPYKSATDCYQPPETKD